MNSAAAHKVPKLAYRLNGSYNSLNSSELQLPADTQNFSLRCTASGAPESLIRWSCANVTFEDNETSINCRDLPAHIAQHVCDSALSKNRPVLL